MSDVAAPAVSPRLWPGVLLAVAGGALATFLAHAVSPYVALSPLLIAIGLGVVLANTSGPAPSVEHGLGFAAKRLLRVGIVLLGLQLALPILFELGPRVLLLVLVVVVVSFVGTLLIGRRCGLSFPQTLLIATGVSICGASAIAAVESLSEAEQEDVMVAVSVISLYGTVAVVVFPLLQQPLGLDPEAFGVWSGASIHEVAQVVAAAGAVGTTALAPAVVVKLTRVVLLAPMVTVLSLWQRRAAAASSARKPPLVPLFVLGFLAAVALRSTGTLPSEVLTAAQHLQTGLLAAAMFGLGSGIRLRALLRTGLLGLGVGLLSTVLISVAALAGVLLLA